MLQITTDTVKIMWRYCLATFCGDFSWERKYPMFCLVILGSLMRSLIAFSLGCIGLTCAWEKLCISMGIACIGTLFSLAQPISEILVHVRKIWLFTILRDYADHSWNYMKEIWLIRENLSTLCWPVWISFILLARTNWTGFQYMLIDSELHSAVMVSGKGTMAEGRHKAWNKRQNLKSSHRLHSLF